jgi:hypothetical protein
MQLSLKERKNNYSAYVPDLPGCIATGATITILLLRGLAALLPCRPIDAQDAHQLEYGVEESLWRIGLRDAKSISYDAPSRSINRTLEKSTRKKDYYLMQQRCCC